ncbi:MAG TPA: hypothetical protein VFC52_05570 [Solirubrobacterales bacterium]|nr:hypothetical protein [Solirubrobacterales bacterium]
MPAEQPAEQRFRPEAAVGECRECETYCDKMIEPRVCAELGCRYLYSHVDELSGTQYVGCMHRVFRGEVALDALQAPGGFGGIKATGQTMPWCQFEVERAYESSGPGYECVNPRFFDCTDQGSEGIRAFDLRTALEPDQP